MSISQLPALNAILNSVSAILLITGYFFIRRKNVNAHRASMISAFVTSTLFLTSYLIYHFSKELGPTKFQGEGIVRPVYYFILITHTILAVAIVPLVFAEEADYEQVSQGHGWTIRGVAARHGLVASLAPKPWPDNAGNGAHVHFSLWSGDRNRFHDGAAPDLLSAEARSFLAGVLEHLPGLCGLAAPSFNSYHRIVPQYWAGAFVCWGHDNREAPVRIASVFRGSEEASTNAELKATDASCNPYLALGGLIAAGLDGLDRRLEPPPEVDVDPATIAEDERATRGIVRLPENQHEALDALADDPVLTGALGPELTTAYLAVRRSEWDVYSAGDDAFEQQGHFEKY